MTEQAGLEKLVKRAVAQALESQLPRLQAELVQSVLQELPNELSSGSAAGGGATAGDLLRAVALIQAGSTQREILKALLEGAIQYSGRAALFVVKGGAASGWQSRGFADNDAIKDFPFDVTSGFASTALQERRAQSGNVSEVDSRFCEQFGQPADSRAMILPLLLKDKVAALVYADAGEDGGKLDPEALELLVVATGAWLEVSSLRKQASKETGEAVPVARSEPAASAAPTFVDPFAGTVPKHAASAPPVPEMSAAVAEHAAPEQSAEEAAEAPVVAMAAAASGGSSAVDPMAGMSPEDADVHRKAQRFARLLVDEIKLYNQAKVSEGRKNKDLYDRLKEDIDKSRATYQKRYGSTAAASGEYFKHELVRSLAEDDPSVMGTNFR
jgi:hypothetical protein